MKTTFKKFILLFSLILIPSFAMAADDDDAIDIGEVVIGASRVEEPVSESTQDVTVITSEEIEKKGVTYIGDLLSTLSDVQVHANGGPGHNTSFFIRGGSSEQAVVMIDGVKVKSTTTGSADLSWLLVDDIERIEIIKGAQSTLYGSEAVAGVVNIVTKKGEEGLGGGITYEGGDYGTSKISGYLTGGNKTIDYRIALTHNDTNGYSAYYDPEAAKLEDHEDDGYINNTLSAKLGLHPTEDFDINLNYRISKDEVELDDSDADNRFYVQEGEHSVASISITQRVGSVYDHTLMHSMSEENMDSVDPNVAWNTYRIDTEMHVTDWQHNVYMTGHTLTFGGEWRKESGDNVGNFDETVKNKAGYINLTGKYFDNSFILSLGGRVDDHSMYGSETTRRGSAMYVFKESDFLIRGTNSTAFRAPTLNDLYYPFMGNPDLLPETSENREYGIEKGFYDGRLRIGATRFKQNFEDMIEYNAMWIPDNIGHAAIKGTEVNIVAKLDDHITFKASHTDLDAIDKDTNEPLLRRPESKATATLEYARGPLFIGFDYIYVSQRIDSAPCCGYTEKPALDSYSIVNVNAKLKIGENLEIFARGENIGDKEYFTLGANSLSGKARYGTAGASAYGGIKVTF